MKKMSLAKNLVARLSLSQERLMKAIFVAPCVPPSTTVFTRVEGMVYSFRVAPGFEGWGLFRSVNSRQAELVEEAGPAQIESYLNALKARREVRLIRPLRGRSWLALAGSAEEPRMVHLVEGGSPWMTCRVRSDGRNLWFQEPAPNADPTLGDQMLRALGEAVDPGALRLPGLTPLDRTAYSMEYFHRFPPVSPLRARERVSHSGRRQETSNGPEGRLGRALARGGGRLHTYTDQGQSWLVQWVDSRGELHTSSIRKDDLEVVSSGLCLSGEDAKFDLTSLVGVVEGSE